MAVARRFVIAALLSAAACGHHGNGNTDAAVDGGYVPDACVGLSCFQFDCAPKGLPPTSISGTVYAPNGTLPLYGVDVYVPREDPGPLTDGAVCSRCDEGLQGGSIAQTKTDEAGHFVLQDVPATADVPVVVQIGKWRRQFKIANVAACEDQAIDPQITRLPKNRTEGDIPRIAISTGGSDALECLPLKLGIDPAEISANSGTGRIHLYTNPGNAGGAGQGAASFRAGWAGGAGPMGDSRNLWDTVAHLKAYDIVFLSCEGDQYPESKPITALQALQQYADLGGRVFASHWHNIWIGGSKSNSAYGIPDWQAVADFNFGPNPSPTDSLTATIDEVANPKGMSFATWMQNVGGSTTRDLIPVTQARTTCTKVNPPMGEQWVFLDTTTSPGYSSSMNFQFTTPQNVDPSLRCGKVVFSDMHVSADSLSRPTVGYPNDCSADLTPQEKALAFMFFDIASCVGAIF